MVKQERQHMNNFSCEALESRQHLSATPDLATTDLVLATDSDVNPPKGVVIASGTDLAPPRGTVIYTTNNLTGGGGQIILPA